MDDPETPFTLQAMQQSLECGSLPIRYTMTGTPFVEGVFDLVADKPECEIDGVTFRYRSFGRKIVTSDAFMIDSFLDIGDIPIGEGLLGHTVDAVTIRSRDDRMVILRVDNTKVRAFVVHTSSANFVVYVTMRFVS